VDERLAGTDLRDEMVLQAIDARGEDSAGARYRLGPLVPGSPIPPDNNGGAGEVRRTASGYSVSAASGLGSWGANGGPAKPLRDLAAVQCLAAASSWDTEAAHLYGDIIGRELRAQGTINRLAGAQILLATAEMAGCSSTPGGKIHCLPV